MAKRPHITNPSKIDRATQPEYRALTVYPQLPEGCIAQLVTDNSSVPHIRPGEFVVVDTGDREVRHLETYVIQWENGSRNVCEAVSREFNEPGAGQRSGWFVRSISGLRGRAALKMMENAAATSPRGFVAQVAGLAWCDGPYRSDDGYLESKIVGCVVGIYAPAFEGQKRIVGRAA